MTVIVLIAALPGLRGHLTRQLLEIAPGVFVGTVTARVRDRLWLQVQKHLGHGGRAVMVHPVRNEHGLSFRVAGRPWEPIDIDGLTLIRRSVQGTCS
jgi:CRISPR-associated protein Cas2